jgi:hypothetical protein
MLNPASAKTLYGLGFKIAFGAYFGYATAQIAHRAAQQAVTSLLKKKQI